MKHKTALKQCISAAKVNAGLLVVAVGLTVKWPVKQTIRFAIVRCAVPRDGDPQRREGSSHGGD